MASFGTMAPIGASEPVVGGGNAGFRFCVDLEQFFTPLPTEEAVTKDCTTGLAGIALLGTKWGTGLEGVSRRTAAAAAQVLPHNEYVALALPAAERGAWGEGTAQAFATALAASITVPAKDKAAWCGVGCVRVRVVRNALLALDGSRAQVCDAFHRLFHGGGLCIEGERVVLSERVIRVARQDKSAQLELLREHKKIMPQLQALFPSLFSSACASSGGMLPLEKEELQGWGVTPDAGPSGGSLMLLKDIKACLSSLKSKDLADVVQSLAAVSSRISQLPVVGADEGSETLARRSQCLLIAHLEGRTSGTRMGASLHVHFSLEPEDFMRWYLSTPAGSQSRGQDGSDVFFVRSSRERHLAESMVGGPTNLPAFQLRFASYQEKDGKRAQEVLDQPPAAALSLSLRPGWSLLPEESEACLSLVLHPCRPRVGIVMQGVAALRGNDKQCASLLQAAIGLDAEVRAALERAPPDRCTSRTLDAALALRLGDSWRAQPPALTKREDSFFAAQEAEGVHVLALWETSPWVYVALLRGTAASAAAGVRWAGPAVEPQAFVVALMQPWGRTREEDGSVYYPI